MQPFTSPGATAYLQMAAAKASEARVHGVVGRAQGSLFVQQRPLA
jgi:hypothetical protein